MGGGGSQLSEIWIQYPYFFHISKLLFELRELLPEEGELGGLVFDELIEEGFLGGVNLALQAYAFDVMDEFCLGGPGLLDLSLLCGDQVVNWVLLIGVLHGGWSWK